MGLMRATFKGTRLDGASFKGANLSRVLMEFASLKGADLTGANLRGPELAGADLTDANIDGANFTDADVNSARIGKMRNRERALGLDSVKNADRADELKSADPRRSRRQETVTKPEPGTYADEDNGSSALMRAAIAGDGGAYARVLTQLAGVVRGAVARHFRRIGYGNEEIEDVVQETLLAIHLKRSSWDPEQPLEPWVRAIARNKVIDHLRRRGYRKFVPIDDVAEVLATPPAEAALSNGDRDRILAVQRPSARS